MQSVMGNSKEGLEQVMGLDLLVQQSHGRIKVPYIVEGFKHPIDTTYSRWIDYWLLITRYISFKKDQVCPIYSIFQVAHIDGS